MSHESFTIRKLLEIYRSLLQTIKQTIYWVSHSVCDVTWVIHSASFSLWCHMWMSHVTCEWVMSHVNESCHMWGGDDKRRLMMCVTSRTQWHTHQASLRSSDISSVCVMSHTWQRCLMMCVTSLTHIRYLFLWVSHITHMNEACYMWGHWGRQREIDAWWPLSESCRMWMSHVAREWVMSHADGDEHGMLDGLWLTTIYE